MLATSNPSSKRGHSDSLSSAEGSQDIAQNLLGLSRYSSGKSLAKRAKTQSTNSSENGEEQLDEEDLGHGNIWTSTPKSLAESTVEDEMVHQMELDHVHPALITLSLVSEVTYWFILTYKSLLHVGVCI